MPTSKIEKELLKVTKLKRKDAWSDQEFYKNLCNKIENLDDDDWEALSADAQEWYNTAVAAINSNKKIKPFADVGTVPADDEDDEDDAPKSKKGAKGKKKPADDDDEDDDEEEDDEDEEDEEDDEPKSKKGGKKKTSSDDEADTSSKGGVKNRIKKLIIANPDTTVDAIMKKLGKAAGVSKVTVSNVRSEFRQTLKFLKDNKVNVAKLTL